jgi:predicted dehydrogenase
MSQLRVMLWGAGFIAGKWLEQLASRTDYDVVGIASRSKERAAERLKAAGLEGVRIYSGWESSLDPATADVVLITLPQELHASAVSRALGAGWHVLVEKPLTITLESARQAYLAGTKCPKQVVMVNQNFRWRPHVQALRKAVREGQVGTVGHVMFECRQQIRRTTIDGWRERMAEPYLLDFAIHHFDLIRYVLGDDPMAVAGRSFRPSWSWFKGQSAAAAVIEMHAGTVVDYGGTMVSSGFETPQEGLITVIGEKGTLYLDAASRVVLVADGQSTVLAQEPVPGGEFGYALDEFAAAIRQRRRSEVSMAEHIRSLAIAFGIIESGRTGRRITCDELLTFLKN